jgi:two-component system chemotaxis sensor kinase CheA
VIAEGASIVYEGATIPFLPLARALGASPDHAHPRSAVIVESGSSVCALGVDQLRGMETVVVRALPALTPSDPVVAGASLDARGNPQLVLEPQGLVAEALQVRPRARGTSTPRLPILVIDDSLTTRMLEQSILESAGYEVDVATSGEDGLDKARRRRYALFLVDVEMPGIDGFEFVERTRADPALGDIPAVLVTSRAAPEDRQRGARAGAAAYIVKSEFDQTELLDRIRGLVSAR